MLSRPELLERLDESVRAIELNIQLYNAGEVAAWMSIATELYKLLIDNRHGALLIELFPDVTLHPLKSSPSQSGEKWLLWSPAFRSEPRKFRFDLFDNQASTLPVDEWLQQDLLEVKLIRPTISEFIIVMRHNIAAHTSRSTPGGKARIIQVFGFLSETGITRSASTRLIVDIAAYLVKRISTEIDRVPGPSLPLLSRRKLLNIADDHNKAKDILDSMVNGTNDLSLSNIQEAVRQYENCARSIIPNELDLWPLLIFTHLGQAYRFAFVASRDPDNLMRAISSLDMARLLLSAASPHRHHALVHMNLGLIYLYAFKRLASIRSPRIALQYFEEAMKFVDHATDEDLIKPIMLGAAKSAFFTLRLARAYRYYRTWNRLVSE